MAYSLQHFFLQQLLPFTWSSLFDQSLWTIIKQNHTHKHTLKTLDMPHASKNVFLTRFSILAHTHTLSTVHLYLWCFGEEHRGRTSISSPLHKSDLATQTRGKQTWGRDGERKTDLLDICSCSKRAAKTNNQNIQHAVYKPNVKYQASQKTSRATTAICNEQSTMK